MYSPSQLQGREENESYDRGTEGVALPSPRPVHGPSVLLPPAPVELNLTDRGWATPT